MILGDDIPVPVEVVIALLMLSAAMFGWALRELYRLAVAVSRLTEKVESLDEDQEDTSRQLRHLRSDVDHLKERS